MTLEAARAAGAKGKPPWLEMPNTTVWVDEKTKLVSHFVVTYERTKLQALMKSWGLPNLGDAWVGKNWHVTVSNCDASSKDKECYASFMRAPGGMLPARPRPPGAFADLRYGMSPAEVRARLGVAFDDLVPVDVGYPLTVRLSYSGEKGKQRLYAIELHAEGLTAEKWRPLLTSLWGEPKELSSGGGEKNVWSAPAEGWHAVFEETPGVVVSFHPLVPFANALAPSTPGGIASVVKQMFGKPPTKNPDVHLPATEYSLHTTTLIPQYEKSVVTSVHVAVDCPNEQRAEMRATLRKAWGAKPKAKPENDTSEAELFTLEAPGLEGLVLSQSPNSETFDVLRAKK